MSLPDNLEQYDYMLVPVKNIEGIREIPLPSIEISTTEGILFLDSKHFKVVRETTLSEAIEDAKDV